MSQPPYLPEQRKVAVTGAHGFIGGEVLRHLERDRRYYKLLAVDIRKPDGPLQRTEFHKLDLTMPAADNALLQLLRENQVDTVLHAAFLSAPAHNPTWAHELESIGTMHVLNACRGCPVRRLVLWSQTLVYGPSPKHPNYLTEEHEPHGLPRSGFVSDKLEAERQVKRFARESPEIAVTILRTATMLGPTVRNFATRFFERPVCPILLGHDPLLQFLHERDAVDAFLLALDGDATGIFNLAADGVLPYSTVLAMLGRVPLPLPLALARPLGQLLWATQLFDVPPDFLDFLRFLCVVDASKAKSVLGFRPRYDIRATIEDLAGLASVPTREAAAS